MFGTDLINALQYAYLGKNSERTTCLELATLGTYSWMVKYKLYMFTYSLVPLIFVFVLRSCSFTKFLVD